MRLLISTVKSKRVNLLRHFACVLWNLKIINN